jgi:Mrp family chromosome partitioning ATPase
MTSATRISSSRATPFRLLATSAKPPGSPPFKPKVAPKPNLENIKHIVAVASGKGGVGKSTVAGIASILGLKIINKIFQ